MFHERIKHVKIDCYFVLDRNKGMTITTAYLPTKSQPDDLPTKTLGKQQHHALPQQFGIHDLFSTTAEAGSRDGMLKDVC